MKKLMLTAVVAAIATGAIAAPLVYDYKASLKHLYLKETTVSYEGEKYSVYTKYQKATALNGFLIMDQDGVTSPAIMTNTVDGVYATLSKGTDYGRSRGFLVVQNNKAYKDVRHPKIIPAVLDAKWLDTQFKKLGTASSGLAEGMLYAGGDAVMPVRPFLDAFLDDDDEWYSVQRDEVPVAPGQRQNGFDIKMPWDSAAQQYTEYEPGMVAIADYLWTSIYLFAGSTYKDAFYNGPNWFLANKKYSPFGHFEYLWDQNLPVLLRTGWKADVEEGATDASGYYKTPVNYYHDTWLNGTGVGKWSKGKITTEYCCGIPASTGSDDRVLETLSGNLKGGLFLCTENGIDAKSTAYSWFLGVELGLEWEDQFNTARLTTPVLFRGDAWQNDLWHDGFMEVETTDVIWGTWSIKINTKFYAEKKPIYKALTDEQVETLKGYTERYLPTTTPAGAEDGTDEWAYDEALWGAINGAALNLNTKANVFDGSEIYSKTVKNRANLPMVTPQFAAYYRLVYQIWDKAQ